MNLKKKKLKQPPHKKKKKLQSENSVLALRVCIARKLELGGRSGSPAPILYCGDAAIFTGLPTTRRNTLLSLYS